MPAFVSPIGTLVTNRNTFICPLSKIRPPSFLPRHVTRRTYSPRMAHDSPSSSPLVPILMGSASDLPFCRKISAALSNLGIESHLRIASAHKVPNRLLELVQQYEALPRPKVYIAVAGRSNALSGVLDCEVASPVISCPPYSEAFGGADLFSSIRMPSGVAPMLVLDPGGAALAAAKILALQCLKIKFRIQTLQRENRDRIYVDDAQLVSEAYRSLIAEARQANEYMVETDPKLLFGSRWSDMVTESKVGKVRDQYAFEAMVDGKREQLLALVTTDRQSAFDRILAAVPFKGAVLNMTSAFWFRNTRHIVANHVVDIPNSNVTIARRCSPFPVEFVVRGYITGSTNTSLWKNYSNGVRNYCGISFKDGLVKNEKLQTNLITPTTKEDEGDRPISPAEIVSEGLMSQEDWDYCAAKALELFEFGQKTAAQNGLILVDTKYEFGKDANGTIRLIDEIHTPDSSRYWLSTSYGKKFDAGEEPENVDKEFLRLWFIDNCEPYDKSKPLPEAPEFLVDELSRRYIMLYELITGAPFEDLVATCGPKGVTNCLANYATEFSPASR